MTNQSKAYFYGILTVLMWSTVATAFKINLQHFDVANMLFWSSLSSAIVFIIFIIFQGKLHLLKSIKFNDLFYFMLLGFLNPFLYYLILFAAYNKLPAQIAQPLNYSWVIVVSILALIMLKHKIKLINFIGLSISFIGIIIISLSNGNINQTVDYFGIFLALSSSLVWGFYWVINVKKKYDDSIKLMFNFLFGTLYSFIYLFVSGANLSINTSGILSSMYIGLFEMGLTFFIWLQALKLADNAAKIGNIIYFSPLISMIFITLVLKEELMITSIIGLIMIICGMLIQQLKFSQTR